MADRGPNTPVPRRGLSVWPLTIALIVALGMIALVIWYMPRTSAGTAAPTNAEVPPQPGGDQLQIKDVTIAESPAASGTSSGNVRLEGKIFNAGQSTVNEIEVEAIFLDSQGRMAHSETEPLSVLVPQGNSMKETAFADAPLARSRTAPFRVTFSAVPDSWNKQLPQLRIIHVGQQQPK
jgi:hypothetical protein